jgi:hypothetical protein
MKLIIYTNADENTEHVLSIKCLNTVLMGFLVLIENHTISAKMCSRQKVRYISHAIFALPLLLRIYIILYEQR